MKDVDSYVKDNELLNKAICFAVDKHAGQVRKGTTIPYIVHPMETMCILVAMKADINLTIAGVLHDVLEDADCNKEEIVENFGADVGDLVCAHTEDKSLTWQERKSHDIEMVRQGSTRLKMLVMADKVANLRSLYRDYMNEGEQVWKRFNAPKEKQAWFHNGLIDAMKELKKVSDTEAVYDEMVELCKRIFSV